MLTKIGLQQQFAELYRLPPLQFAREQCNINIDQLGVTLDSVRNVYSLSLRISRVLIK